MGLQRLSAESRHRHMSHKSAVFLPQWSAALLSVRWALNGKVDGDCLLIQDGVLTIPTKKRQKVKVFRKVFLIFRQKNDQHKCQPFTIPTFQALNVRFSVKIFAIFLSQRKNKAQCPDEWA